MPSFVSRVVLAAALLPALALAAPPAQPAAKSKPRPSKQYTIEQFMATTPLLGRLVLPGREEAPLLLERDAASSTSTACRWRAASPRRSPSPRRTPPSPSATSPSDERILFTRDQGGNENNHLYVRDAGRQGEGPHPGRQAEGRVRWAGSRTTTRPSTCSPTSATRSFFDLYQYDAKTYERTLLFQNDGGFEFADISRDEKWIALDKPRTTADSDVYLYDVAKKETKHITPHKGIAQLHGGHVRPGLQRAVLPDQRRLASSPAWRATRWPTESCEDVEKADWDVMYTYFSENGAYRVTAINEDGRTVIRLHDVKAGKQVALPQLPEGDITSVVHRPQREAHGLLPQRRPLPEQPLRATSSARGKATRLTDTLNPEIDAEDLVESAGGALQVLRRDGHPQHPLQAAPGHGRGQGARARLGARRPRRTDAQGLHRPHPVPGQPRLRGAGHQQPRQLRLRQDVLHRGRPEARPGAAAGTASRPRSTWPACPTWTATASASSAAATAAT